MYIVTRFAEGGSMITEVTIADETFACGGADHDIEKGDLVAWSDVAVGGQAALPYCGRHAVVDPTEASGYFLTFDKDEAERENDRINLLLENRD